MSIVTDRMSEYNRNAILSATPVQLLTMLYDRLLLDLHRAEQAQVAEHWMAATPQLLHAQDIIAELQATLKPELWSGGRDLAAIYTYVTAALIGANVSRDVTRTRECIALLEPLRQSWHEAGASLSVSAVPVAAVGTRVWADA